MEGTELLLEEGLGEGIEVVAETGGIEGVGPDSFLRLHEPKKPELPRAAVPVVEGLEWTGG